MYQIKHLNNAGNGPDAVYHIIANYNGMRTSEVKDLPYRKFAPLRRELMECEDPFQFSVTETAQSEFDIYFCDCECDCGECDEYYRKCCVNKNHGVAFHMREPRARDFSDADGYSIKMMRKVVTGEIDELSLSYFAVFKGMMMLLNLDDFLMG